jgi:hypothetical protein
MRALAPRAPRPRDRLWGGVHPAPFRAAARRRGGPRARGAARAPRRSPRRRPPRRSSPCAWRAPWRPAPTPAEGRGHRSPGASGRLRARRALERLREARPSPPSPSPWSQPRGRRRDGELQGRLDDGQIHQGRPPVRARHERERVHLLPRERAGRRAQRAASPSPSPSTARASPIEPVLQSTTFKEKNLAECVREAFRRVDPVSHTDRDPSAQANNRATVQVHLERPQGF